MNPAIVEYLIRKKQQESEGFGLPEAAAVGLSGLGDAFKGAAGMNTNHAKETLGVIQGGDKSRMEQIKTYFEGKKTMSDIAKNEAEAKKLGNDKPKPAGLYTFNPKDGKTMFNGKEIASDQVPADAQIQRMTDPSSRDASLSLREELADEKRKIAEDEINVPGYEIEPGIRFQKEEAQKARKAISSFSTMDKGISRMKQLVDKYGSYEFSGPESGEMDSLATGLQVTAKELYDLGVLNGPDMTLLQKQFQNPDTLKSMFTRDKTRQAELDTALSTLKTAFQEGLKSKGYRQAGGGAPPPAENPQGGKSGMTPEQRRSRIAFLKAKQIQERNK